MINVCYKRTEKNWRKKIHCKIQPHGGFWTFIATALSSRPVIEMLESGHETSCVVHAGLTDDAYGLFRSTEEFSSENFLLATVLKKRFRMFYDLKLSAT